MARVVVQRVSRASVDVDGKRIAAIDRGLCILIGIRAGDSDRAVDALASKVAGLRIFEDDQGKMNLSNLDVGGKILVVSQFTLLADTRKGRRPSFIEAAGPEEGRRLYDRFAEDLRTAGYIVEQGQFGAHMQVEICNDGPVTILLDSENL